MKEQINVKPFKRNPIADRDAYKGVHWLQLKKAYEWFTSYMEARKGAAYEDIYAMGLSHRIKTAYGTPPSMDELDVAESLFREAFGFDALNVEVWKKVVELGHYPMLIKGLPEGTKVSPGVPLFTIEPTEKWFASTANGEETKLMRTWYASVLISRLMNLNNQLIPLALKTNSLAQLQYFVNGFEARSATSDETADIAGMFSLFVTGGSDNIHAQHALNHFYPGGETRLKTVWATEHACALSFGPGEGEYDYVKAQLSTKTNFIKSIVIDTYDTKNFVDNVLTRPDIRKMVMAHEGLIVLRNDSGNMYEMIEYILNSMDTSYGSTYHTENYRILNKFGVMQADGVKPHTTVALAEKVIDMGYALHQLVVGGGTGLMFDDLTRDTNRNAIKPSANIIDGEMISTKKSPKTDPSKNSKGGILKVDKNHDVHSSNDYTPEEFAKIKCIMVTYYENGKIYSDDFKTIYNRLHQLN